MAATPAQALEIELRLAGGRRSGAAHAEFQPGVGGAAFAARQQISALPIHAGVFFDGLGYDPGSDQRNVTYRFGVSVLGTVPGTGAFAEWLLGWTRSIYEPDLRSEFAISWGLGAGYRFELLPWFSLGPRVGFSHFPVKFGNASASTQVLDFGLVLNFRPF